MKRWIVLAIGACLAGLGCERDPASSVRIVERRPDAPAQAAAKPPADNPVDPGGGTAAPTTASAAPPAGAKPADPAAFRLAACPPPPEGGPEVSSFTLAGPCAFEQRAAVSCEALFDDFIMIGTRKAKNGATVMIYINVEKYTGPGDYTEAQMFVGVQDKVNIWRWSNDNVNITVGKDEQFAELPSAKLEAEPVLVNCTGPMNNYQCEGRGDEPAFDSSIEVVRGRLQCEAPAKPGQ